MRCPACSAKSEDTARFCAECGVALVAVCPQCGHRNPPGGRFCAQCGVPLAASAAEAHFGSPRSYTPVPLAEKILSERSLLEGERKQITALFADVASFTSMAERLDPEECYGLMKRCFDLMLAEVHRYEGTVTQFLGDGILALFGAPISHEDHALRAVHAALGIQRVLRAYQQELQESRGILFRMRVGLNSGLVVVSTIGTDLHMTYTAVGDTVNLASRVQALAEPGTVVISENTHRLVSGYFDTRDLGEHQVRGKELPVGAYEVVQPRRWRSRVAIGAEQGLTPWVGRDADLERLLERYALSRAGEGQVVLIRGEAGVGKSRLLYELRRRLEAEEPPGPGHGHPSLHHPSTFDGAVGTAPLRAPAHEVGVWLEGRCISYGRDAPYLPIVDLLKDRFEIAETDAEETIVRKVDAAMLGSENGAATALPFLKYLLAVDPGDASVASMDPQMRRARLFEAVRALLITTSHTRPLVVVFEDLHWIDRVSEDLLLALAKAVPSQRILLLLTYRPGYEPRFETGPSVTEIDLRSLSEEESARVAIGHLGAESIPEELQALIYRKAEGNPFFVEEVTRSLLESGALRRSGSDYLLTRPVEEIDVPDTVQDVIMARLDRLPEEPKRALQTASVIGREFTARLLDRTAVVQGRLEELLWELQSVELIYEHALYPELAYMFKHALTHDVAYHSLLLVRRRLLHRLVGEAIEELYRDRLEEQYETLAYHFERAEVWEKALEYLQKCGEKALAAFAPQQAASFYRRAATVLTRPGTRFAPAQAIAVHRGRGEAHLLTNEWEESLASFRAMRDAARDTSDLSQEGLALARMAEVCYHAHDPEPALEYAGSAYQLALQTHDPGIRAGSLIAMALVHSAYGNLQELGRELEEALWSSDQAGSPYLQGMTRMLTGFCYLHRGEETRAAEVLEEAVQIGREHRIADLWLPALTLSSWARTGLGQYERALQCLMEVIGLADRVGDRIWRGRAFNSLGWVYMDLCHWELALQWNKRGADEARALGDLEMICNAELNAADCYLALGALEEAQRYLETVDQECRSASPREAEFSGWRYRQHLAASLGELWLRHGDAGRALAFAETCLAAAEAYHSPRNIIKGRRLKGEALLAQGRLEGAERELETALRVAREIGNPAQIWKTLAALGCLRRAQGRPQDAAVASREACGTIESVAAGLSDPELRNALLASSQAAALREAIV